jgi:hypothetical protein
MARPAAATFYPTDIAGSFLGWDPAHTASLTQSGGLCSAIADRSAAGDNSGTASGAQRPTVTTDATTGLTVLTFASAARMTVTDKASLEPTQLTIYAAINASSLATYRYLLSKDGTTGTAAYGIYSGAGGDDLKFNVNGVTTSIKTGGITGRHILTCTYDLVNRMTKWDNAGGNSAAYTTAISTNATDLIVGDAASTGGFVFTGDLLELWMFNTGHNSTQRTQMYDYLKAKHQTA